MALDTINYTEPGSGTAIAFDDCGGSGEVQLVKLAYSSLGSASLITADASGLLVNVTKNDPTPISAQSISMASASNAQTIDTSACATVTVDVTGTWTGTLIFEAITQGSYRTTNAVTVVTGSIVSTITANGTFIVPCGGYSHVRVRCSVTGTGSASVSMNAGAGCQGVVLAASIPTGTNVIGGVTAASGAIASGAIASGAIASGAIASGAIASGAIAAGAIAAGATSFVKLEDAASADADAGAACLAVRKATPANTSGTDGDYEFLQISAGRLWASATIDAALPAGANVIGALTAHQSTNVDQWNGVAPTAATALSDTFANPTAPPVGACHLEWDGTQWVRAPGTIKGTALASAARTAQATATLTKPKGYVGLALFLRITIAGTSTVTLFVQGTDPVSGVAGTWWNAGVITAATGSFAAVLYPGVAAAPGGTALATPGTIGLPMPEDIIVGVSKGDASSWTYSLGYCWLA